MLNGQLLAKDPSFPHADSKDWSDWADAQADPSLRLAHVPFCWFCHEAAHIAMMDCFRQQFYPSLRQAGRDRKIFDSHRKGYSCPMCENGLSQMMHSQIKFFNQQCPLSRSNNRNNIKNDRKDIYIDIYIYIISVWDSNPGLSSAKEIVPLFCLIP